MTLEEEFRVGVRKHLDKIGPQVAQVLSTLARYEFPKEVTSLEFEVFTDGFTSGFPVRAFFLDDRNCEYFIYENGAAAYPSPVDPGLIEIDEVFPEEFEEEYLAKDDSLDTFTLAGLETISWFSELWRGIGGGKFPRLASIRLHDGSETYDLGAGTWRG